MKTKMKIQECLKKVLVIFMLIVLFSPKAIVNAGVTVEQAGQAIASFAIDFYNKYGKRVSHYNVDLGDPVSYGKRGAAYKETTVGSMEKYYMDCVGWVSYAVHHATGLDHEKIRSGETGFVVPGHVRHYFEVVTGELQPGDILSNSHHVMIYVGNNKIIDSRSKNGLTYTTIEEYGGGYNQVFRLTASAASGINPENLSPIISGLAKSNTKKKKDYNYYGMPTKGEYVGSSGLSLTNVINKLSQIADYLIGFITYGIKLSLIGWATIFENHITDMVNKITGSELPNLDNSDEIEDEENENQETEENDEETDEENAEGGNGTVAGNIIGDALDNIADTLELDKTTQETGDLYTPDALETVTGYFTDKNNRLTVEKIIYNEVPIFDVNIFNIEEAGGQELNPDGTLATIKRNIAKWYYVFRNLSIICLLLVLLYIGIRMAISTAAEEKAVYKRYLKDWVVSFIIVFCIHYVMIFILNINEYLVGLFRTSMPNQEHSLYETVRTKAYEIKFTSGIAGTMMYIYLIYLMIKFLFIYAKRYLTMNILAVIAPLIGISYSIDKIKDNKSQSFNAWLADFALTALLQTIHALVYTLFISVALETSQDNIGGTIFAFVLLNFMTKADKILMKIFNFQRGKGLSNIIKGDGMKQFLSIFAGAKTVKAFYGTAFNMAKGTVRGVGRVGSIVIPNRIRFRANDLYNRATEKVLGENNFLDKRRTNDIKTVSGIDDKIKQKKSEYRNALKKQISAPFKMAKTGASLVTKTATLVPAMIESPKEAITRIAKIRGIAGLLKKQAKQSKFVSPKTGEGSLNNIVNSHNRKRVGLFTPRLAQKNAEEQTTKLQGRFAKSISMLEEAKSLEEGIISKYSNLKDNIYARFGGSGNPYNTSGTRSVSQLGGGTAFGNNNAPGAGRASGPVGGASNGGAANVGGANGRTSNGRTAGGSSPSILPNAVVTKVNTQYNKMVEEIFKEVEEVDVKKTVDKFVKERNSKKIKEEDVGKLLQMLKNNLDKKENNNIELTNEAAKNIKMTMQKNAETRLAKGIENALKQNDIDTKEIDLKTQENIVRDMKKAIEKKGNEQTLIQALEKSFAKNDVTISISDNVKKEIVNNLQARVEREKERVYTPTEIIKIMKKGLDKKDSIKREKAPDQLLDIAEDMENLRELNNNYKEQFGEKIFDTKEIIQAMRATKRAKKYDLYDEIMNA